ncbi:MAG: hypothetical protein ACRDT4_02125 [Micromonosporaceae bacterium]
MSQRGFLLVVGLLLAGCALQPGEVKPVPEVTFKPPSTLLAPAEPPSGLHLEQIVEPDKLGWHPAEDRIAVYGEPNRAEPGTGRLLLAAYVSGSDSALGLPRKGGTYGKDTWRVWDYADDKDQERDQLGVMGRGLSDSELADAQAAAVGDPKHGLRIGANGVPEGLEPLGMLPVRASADRHFIRGTTLVWSGRGRGASISLTLADTDGALVRALVRGEPVKIRGSEGVAGVPVGVDQDGDEPTLWVWSEGDTVAVVASDGAARSEVEAFIESLAPVDPAKLETLRRTILDYPPVDLVDAVNYPDARVVASGRTAVAVWAVSLRPGKGGSYRVGETWLHVREGWLLGGEGDVNPANVRRDGFWVVRGNQDVGESVAGAATPAAVTVRVHLGKGGTADVPVQHIADPKLGFFGYWAEGDKITSLDALDASGKVIATHRW